VAGAPCWRTHLEVRLTQPLMHIGSMQGSTTG
jgi:hypothetical protein